MIAIVASPPTIQASYEQAMNAMTARPSYGGSYRPSYAELAGGQRLKLNAAKLPTIRGLQYYVLLLAGWSLPAAW